jgi:integrase/recombinase XerD
MAMSKQRRGTAGAQALTLYLDNLAPSGRRSARSRLRAAAAILGHRQALEGVPWARLGFAELAEVRAALLRARKAPSTINATLAALRGVLKTAFGLGLIPAEGVLRLDRIKRVTGARVPAGRALTSRELDTLLRTCRRAGTPAGVRDAAMIALMGAVGLRRSEVVGLTVGDYEPRRGRLLVRAGKGGRQRELLLPGAVRRDLAAWLKVRGRAEGALFCPLTGEGVTERRALSAQRVYDVVVERAFAAGIGRCTPHDLRRTFVTQLLDRDVDLNTVRQLAGHSDLQTTARYDRRDQRAQRRALRQPGAVQKA